MSIEEYLKELIKLRGFTVKSFSEYIKIPYSTLRDIFSRDIRKTSIENFLKICKGLDINSEKLLSEFDKPDHLNNYLLSLESDFEHKNVIDERKRRERMIEFIESMGYSFDLVFNDLYNDDMVSLVNEETREEVYVSYNMFMNAWNTTKKKMQIDKYEIERQHFDKLINLLSNTSEESTVVHETTPVYVTEKAAAGFGYSYGNNETVPYYTDRSDLHQYDLATLVDGDSMEPDYMNGDVVLVKSGYDNVNGDVYLVDYDGKSYIKKLYNDGDRFRLVSINRMYPNKIIDIPIDDSVYFNIVGKVVDSFTPIK